MCLRWMSIYEDLKDDKIDDIKWKCEEVKCGEMRIAHKMMNSNAVQLEFQA